MQQHIFSLCKCVCVCVAHLLRSRMYLIYEWWFSPPVTSSAFLGALHFGIYTYFCRAAESHIICMCAMPTTIFIYVTDFCYVPLFKKKKIKSELFACIIFHIYRTHMSINFETFITFLFYVWHYGESFHFLSKYIC